MSKCVSAQGEYSEHELGSGDMEFVCTLCYVLDEEVIKAELDRLRAQVAAVEALTGGPFSDGYRPYAMEVNGEVVLGVGLDDLRTALGEKP